MRTKGTLPSQLSNPHLPDAIFQLTFPFNSDIWSFRDCKQDDMFHQKMYDYLVNSPFFFFLN